MQEPTFLILTALAGQPLHGYGVIRAVDELSAGEVKLRPGTLYGALDRLAEQGLVTVDREEAVEGRLRRYYRLSDTGAAALQVQIERLRRHATAAETQLGKRLGGALSFGTVTG
ncbi:helix-turn-helix transcriptional regulator [Micromonospora sp. Llam7]|uniref:PadR family transcriptional regulator n=1 Tax=Micromonospora tarapacensis TaxID=2835305 RepID=UPI001C835E46|nr:helix-turn-helix transcriptional regulator [Micromonospora tarapacensis]